MKRYIVGLCATVLAGLMVAAYLRPGPISQTDAMMVIDGTSLGDTPSFTWQSLSHVNVGGYSSMSIWVDYTRGSCSEVCMQCYAVRNGSSTRYTLEGSESSAAEDSATLEERSYSKPICKSVSSSGSWMWTKPILGDYADCDFTGSDCNTDDLLDVYVTNSAANPGGAGSSGGSGNVYGQRALRGTVCNDGTISKTCDNYKVIDAGTDVLSSIATVNIDGYSRVVTNVWLTDANADCDSVTVRCYTSVDGGTQFAPITSRSISAGVSTVSIMYDSLARADAIQGESLIYDVWGAQYFRCWYSMVGTCSGDDVDAQWSVSVGK